MIGIAFRVNCERLGMIVRGLPLLAGSAKSSRLLFVFRVLTFRIRVGNREVSHVMTQITMQTHHHAEQAFHCIGCNIHLPLREAIAHDTPQVFRCSCCGSEHLAVFDETARVSILDNCQPVARAPDLAHLIASPTLTLQMLPAGNKSCRRA